MIKIFENTMMMMITIHFNNGDFDDITVISLKGNDNVLIEYKSKKYICKCVAKSFNPDTTDKTIMTKIYSNNRDFDDVTVISEKNNDYVIIKYKNKKYKCECVFKTLHSNITDLICRSILCNKFEEIKKPYI